MTDTTTLAERDQSLRDFARRHRLAYLVRPHPGPHGSAVFEETATCFDVTLFHPPTSDGSDLVASIRAGETFQLFAGPLARLPMFYATIEEGLAALWDLAERVSFGTPYEEWDDAVEYEEEGFPEEWIHALWAYCTAVSAGLTRILGEDGLTELCEIMLA